MIRGEYLFKCYFYLNFRWNPSVGLLLLPASAEAAPVVLIRSVIEMLSKKRKVNTEGPIFQDKWKEKYLFWEVGSKPMCLICSQQVAVAKEYDIKRHYKTHTEKYGEYKGQLWTQKLNELASSLQKQQAECSKCQDTHEGSFNFYT